MYKYLRIFSHIAGVFGAAIATYLLCHEHSTYEVGPDYLGIVIGVLAILVTLLVAWNIYSALGIERKLKEALYEQNQHFQEQTEDISKFKNEIESKMDLFNLQFLYRLNDKSTKN